MAECRGWLIFPLRSTVDETDTNNLSELWNSTKDIKKYMWQTFFLKTAEHQIGTLRVDGAMSQAFSHLPSAQLVWRFHPSVAWGYL